MPNPNSITRAGSGFAKRILVILAVGTVAAVAMTFFFRSSRSAPQPPPPPEAMARMSPKKLQSHAADNGVMGGARAAEQTMAVSITTTTTEPTHAVAPDPIGDSTTAVRFVRIRSESPQPSKDKAMNDALLVARQKIVDHLRSLDPPVETIPTLDDVRNKYVKPESVVEVQPTEAVRTAWAESKLEPNRMWVEIDVEVTDNHVRELRAKDRITSAGWISAGVFLLVATLFGFLRLDAWTRGYLTTFLGLGAAALAGGGLALLAFMR